MDSRFLDCLFEPDDLVEVRLLPSKRRFYKRVHELPDVADELRQRNDAGDNIYLSANPRRRRGGRAGDVALARSLFVDVDHATVEEALQRVRTCGLPEPTCTVDSGHGVHCYWRLTEPVADPAVWTRAQKHLIGLLGADKSVHDMPRIMRLPGFVNCKPPVAPCVVVDAVPTARYRLDELVPVDGAPVADYWLARALRRAAVGKRNDSGLWLACQLRDAGVSEADALEVAHRYAAALGDDYTADEAAASCRSAYTRPAREPAAGVAVATDDEPDPPIIALIEAALPEIGADVLPRWAADFVTELSSAKETPPALAVLLTLPTMAACVQRAYVVAVEGSYREPLCIYAAPAMESGERKTAVHGPIVAPLFTYQRGLRDEARGLIRELDVKRRLIQNRIKAMEREHLKDGADVADEIVRLTAELPPELSPPQLIAEDFTEAALGVALAANAEALLVTSDEGGLFDNLAGRHNELAEVDLFLKAHVGSPHTVNRVGRENLILTRPLLSVAISPQPGVLAKLGRKPGFLERGLLARFLWALPASRVGGRRLEPANIHPVVAADYHNAILDLARIGYTHDGEQPTALRLDREAYAEWKRFEREIEPRIGRGGDLRGVKPWASKLPGAVARIAAVCHLGEHLDGAAAVPISAPQVERAVALARLLIPHGVAAHRLMGGGGFNIAQEVVAHYNAAGWPREAQTMTAWWRPVRGIVGDTSAAFAPVADVLVDHGYLVAVPERRGSWFRANRSLSNG